MSCPRDRPTPTFGWGPRFRGRPGHVIVIFVQAAASQAVARTCLSLLKQRTTKLRALYSAESKAGGCPPAHPRRFRLASWSDRSGMTAANDQD
jgi:hypothetical protein